MRAIYHGAVVLLVVALTIVGCTGTAVAHGGDDGVHHHDGWMGMHGNMGWVVLLWMLAGVLVLIGIPALLVYAITAQGTSGADGGDDALSVLRTRYARGEIDDEEFETR